MNNYSTNYKFKENNNKKDIPQSTFNEKRSLSLILKWHTLFRPIKSGNNMNKFNIS